MIVFRRVALIIPALLIALPAAAFNLVSSPSIDLASAPACPAPTFSGAAATVTCAYTGGQQTWTVPPAITSATFATYGAKGGNLNSAQGGSGGAAVATIAVTPASTFTVVVGGAGLQGYPSGSGAGGFNGGGNNGGGSANGGGGGGGSDVRSPGTDLASRILVAGGGGGAGNFSTGGGAGGGLTGTAGGNAPSFDGTGGGPGTQSGGGSGGSGSSCCGSAGGGGGSLGAGGNGGAASSGSGGGGGGGGYYGGGGAGNNSAGGGGSGFGPIGTAFSTGVESGNGVVVITYTRLTPTVTLTSSRNPSSFGQSVTFTATVSSASGTPTGSVTFLDGGSSIGTGTLTSGVATLSTSSLAVGGHTFSADYGGDLSFDSLTGSLTGNPQVVDKADTTTSVTGSANPSVSGQSITLTATESPVAPGAGTPTGTVTFLDGGSPLGTGTLSSGVTTFSTSALGVGPHAITANYPGDGNFNGSAGALTGTPQVVNRANTTTSVSSTSPSDVGQAVTFTATLAVTAPGTGTPTGTFAFTNDGNLVTACGGVDVASGTCNITETSAGTHTVAATYSGDADFGGSSGSTTQSVTAASTTTVLTLSPALGVVGGESVTSTAVVSVVAPGTGVPTGSVTFSDGSTALGSAPLVWGSHGDEATFTTDFATGTHSIVATYDSDSDFATSTSATAALTVAEGATAVTLSSSPNPAVAGEDVTLTATVTPKAPSTQTPTGSVQFYDGTTLLGTAPLKASGPLVASGVHAAASPGAATATLVVAFAAGSHELEAVYGGNAAYSSVSTVAHSDVEAVNAVPVPSTGAGASSIVQLGALLMLAGLVWTGGLIRRRRVSRSAR